MSVITVNLNITTSSVPEGSNLYFTNNRVLITTLAGLSVSGGSISSSDTIITAFGKIQNQINGVLGGANYQGTWNATTNSPAIVGGVGTKGYYYVVSVSGSTSIDGITDWKVGDWIIYNGTAWQKVDNTDAVSSVNGQIGAVSLTTSNITEGSNLYYTDTRARAAITGTTNRITVTTGVVDISVNYAGQTSITTLGTITTGTLGPGAKILVGSDATGDIWFNAGGGAIGRAENFSYNYSKAGLTIGGASVPFRGIHILDSGGVETDYGQIKVDAGGAGANASIYAQSTTNGSVVQIDVYGSAAGGTTDGISRNGMASIRIFPAGTGVGIISVAGAYPLILSTNGAERMRINSDGKVGIGIAATELLHVASAASTNFLLENSATSNAVISVKGGAGKLWSIGSTGSGSGFGANRMVFFNDAFDPVITLFGSDVILGGLSTIVGEVLSVQKSQNANTISYVYNSDEGTAAIATLAISAGMVDSGYRCYSNGYTTAGLQIQASNLFYNNGAGGITFAAYNAAGEIRLVTGAFSTANIRWTIDASGHLNANEGINIITGTTTGTKIGTATSQKLSLWNATPNVQPTNAIAAAAFVANTSAIADDTATFGGYTIGQVVAALKRLGALA